MRRNEGSFSEQMYDGHAVEWMKTHTIQDLKLMAFELDQQGQETMELWDLINDLKIMSL
ncbi:MAG TPA: hypothetical protein PLC39_05230 [Methanomassiliicoccales archaeon]|nr:hypothetical protein [Methanomassiliicoccales archaeon]HPR98682.1 hypothetical protein [Methanomassiliicoccales archaeon]